MRLSEQYWSRLLQEFGCDSDEQLAALGIPIGKNELYLSALSNGDEWEKQRYETTAAAALLYTHYHFVHHALKNDALMMYLWAKNYAENCAPEDELNQIHQKIIANGGLYQYSHQNVDAVGTLLSAYQRLGLLMDSDQACQLKQLYTDSMKEILNCIARGLKETKQHFPSLQDETKEKPLPRKKKDEGYSLEKFRSNAHFKARKAATMAKIEKYCGYLFSEEEHKKTFGFDRPEQQDPVPVQEIFLSAPQKYALTEDADGYGLSVEERYEVMLREVCAAKSLPMEKIFSLVQSAVEATSKEAVYQSIWQNYASAVLNEAVEKLRSFQQENLDKMQSACDMMHDNYVNEHYQRICRELSSASVAAENRKNAVCGGQRNPDAQTRELFLRHCGDIKAECDRIQALADGIQAEYRGKVKKRRRKELTKKILLWSAVALAVLAASVIVLEVLL